MPHSAAIKCLLCAFPMLEEIQAQGIEWGEDYRHAAGVTCPSPIHRLTLSGI